MSTEVRYCGCFHPGQDLLHGNHMRVHNQGVKGWKCTVCGTVAGAGIGNVTTLRGGKKK